MNTKLHQSAIVFGKLLRKVGESALHAGIFAFVSKKVSNYMDQKSKEEQEKVRVSEDKTIIVSEKVI